MNLLSFMLCIMFGRRIGRTAGLFISVPVLLLAPCTKSSAAALSEAGYESLLPESALASFQTTVAEVSDGAAMAGSSNKGLLIGNVPFAAMTTSSAGNISTPAAGATPGKSPSRKTVAEKITPNWSGVWFDTGVLAGAQAVAAGVLYIAPESVSNWDDEKKKSSFRQYNNNFANPEIDDDQLYINYVLHPYWGATYYIRGRERGLDQTSSFVFSTLISAMYEFGVECIFENPSIQDLIVTPVVGSLIGAYIFEPWRESIKRKGELRWYDHAGLIFTDPIGVLCLGVEKMFGLKPTITVDYSVPKLQTRSSAPVIASNDNRIGVVIKFSFN